MLLYMSRFISDRWIKHIYYSSCRWIKQIQYVQDGGIKDIVDAVCEEHLHKVISLMSRLSKVFCGFIPVVD